MVSQMSRGEMIRRLDDVSTVVRDGLAIWPLSRSERDALVSSLQTLLPIVAESLQDQESDESADKCDTKLAQAHHHADSTCRPEAGRRR